ncbi:alpha/beta hydrolase [Mycobacterium florentinum]|uniref:Alpha/beta hydrolase n=1 Tax=Mycobacterium florentinum TaxID=292462 RepID=A0A1X1U6B1_MYCFL|nr:alpha/beta hydrolase [Mycobacterium florentinum]MCV7410012.1 alpha/beta hydrolase [Mycobacterium florentinum]ORV52355.1 alpha/beta hydrolase [Mycobacterium florentinum]BBX79318.1 esterase [Mycobacterium florentinum]
MPNSDVHPDLRRIARIAPRQLVTPRSVSLIRALLPLRTLRKSDASEAAEPITLASGAGVRLFRPPGVTEPGPALLWIHGGGYVIGTAAQDDRVCHNFSTRLGITVASVEYRLAPEHPYPTPVEDCYSVLTWLAGLPAVDPTRVAIAGASAGGGLAAALAFLARDRGEVTPLLQMLVYPMIDDRSSLTAGKPDYRLWSTRSNQFGWAAYLGDADPQVAVPARRDDLAGLAPAWIGVGTHDLFHDEDLAYAERLRAAGVPCQVEIVPGAFHGFDLVAPKVKVSQRFFDTQCETLRTALAVAR